MVRGQFPGLRGRQDAPARHGFHHPAPDQVQEVRPVNYLVAGRSAVGRIAIDASQIIAQGDAMVFEGPWPWDAPIVARIDDAAIERVRATGIDGYLVDGLAAPGAGEAFVVAAHRMRDVKAFQPYAAQVGAIVERFGG